MSANYYVEPLMVIGEDGTALSNSTTATSILPAHRKPTLNPSFFDQASKSLRITLSGRISTVVTTPGTLTLDVRFGSTVVFNGGAMTLNTTAQTNVNWLLYIFLTARTLGASTSGTAFGQGYFESHAVIGSSAPTSGGAGKHILPYNSAPAVGNGFDMTQAQQIDVFATWSVASSSNSIQVHQGLIESVN
jgi:hypothetical protein